MPLHSVNFFGTFFEASAVFARILRWIDGWRQGCQMVYFQNKNSNLGKFWKVLQWKMLVFLWSLGLFYGYLVYFVAIWYILHMIVRCILWSFGICIFPVLVCCTT
jgi:hypothetical protein